MQQIVEAPSKAFFVSDRLFYPAVVICSFFLLIPAFYNGYPLVNPDTATYLASGFIPETPFDRPITYGLFARLSSLNGLSLWLVIFMQGYIVSWLIFLVVRAVTGAKGFQNLKLGAVIVALLSCVTSLSWVVCQVQPDVFTPVAYLCMGILLMAKEGRANTIVVYILFFISVAMHMSHPILLAGSALCLFLLRGLFITGVTIQAAKRLLVLFVLSGAATGIMGAALSKSKHVFFYGSLLTKGVAQEYLADSCGAKNYKLCPYRASLTTDSDYFMWNPESPLYRIGGWQDAKPELTSMINDILTTPHYQRMYAKATATQAARQLVTFGIGGGNDPLAPASSVGGRIAAYFPHEAAQFTTGRQNTQNLHEAFKMPNQVFAIVICIGVLMICYMIARWRTLQPGLKVMVVVCLSGIILNVADCAAFGTLHPRYGAKMIWLLPVCAFLFLTTIFIGNKKDKLSAQ